MFYRPPQGGLFVCKLLVQIVKEESNCIIFIWHHLAQKYLILQLASLDYF